MPSESWINLSDRLVKAFHLPFGTTFRIYPVIGTVDNQDPEDHSYNVNWEEGKQYWYDIVYDEAKDRSGHSKLVRMVDAFGRVDTFVVRNVATTQEIAIQWKTLMEIPEGIQIGVRQGTTWNSSGDIDQQRKRSHVSCERQTFTETLASLTVQTNSGQNRSDESWT
jgi:hypothetical protein